VVHFNEDVFGGALAEADLMLHLPTDVVDIVVDHGEGDDNGEDRHDAEGDCGIGDELVGLDAAVR